MSVEEEHIPLKDQFSGDESDIDIDIKEQEPKNYSQAVVKGKKIKKKSKNFTWKCRWIKIPNAVPGSGPVLVRRWVKIKLDQQTSENQSQSKNENRELQIDEAEGEVDVEDYSEN